MPLGQAAFGGAAVVPALSSTTQPFSFGSTAADKPVNSAAPFSFGQSNSGAAVGNSMFSSGGAAGAFSFGLNTATTTSNAAPAATEVEDEDNPPVVEVKQVEESDAIYDKKCKLFYKKDGNTIAHISFIFNLYHIRKLCGERCWYALPEDGRGREDSASDQGGHQPWQCSPQHSSLPADAHHAGRKE